MIWKSLLVCCLRPPEPRNPGQFASSTRQRDGKVTSEAPVQHIPEVVQASGLPASQQNVHPHLVLCQALVDASPEPISLYEFSTGRILLRNAASKALSNGCHSLDELFALDLASLGDALSRVQAGLCWRGLLQLPSPLHSGVAYPPQPHHPATFSSSGFGSQPLALVVGATSSTGFLPPLSPPGDPADAAAQGSHPAVHHPHHHVCSASSGLRQALQLVAYPSLRLHGSLAGTAANPSDEPVASSQQQTSGDNSQHRRSLLGLTKPGCMAVTAATADAASTAADAIAKATRAAAIAKAAAAAAAAEAAAEAAAAGVSAGPEDVVEGGPDPVPEAVVEVPSLSLLSPLLPRRGAEMSAGQLQADCPPRLQPAAESRQAAVMGTAGSTWKGVAETAPCAHRNQDLETAPSLRGEIAPLAGVGSTAISPVLSAVSSIPVPAARPAGVAVDKAASPPGGGPAGPVCGVITVACSPWASPTPGGAAVFKTTAQADREQVPGDGKCRARGPDGTGCCDMIPASGIWAEATHMEAVAESLPPAVMAAARRSVPNIHHTAGLSGVSGGVRSADGTEAPSNRDLASQAGAPAPQLYARSSVPANLGHRQGSEGALNAQLKGAGGGGGGALSVPGIAAADAARRDLDRGRDRAVSEATLCPAPSPPHSDRAWMSPPLLFQRPSHPHPIAGSSSSISQLPPHSQQLLEALSTSTWGARMNGRHRKPVHRVTTATPLWDRGADPGGGRNGTGGGRGSLDAAASGGAAAAAEDAVGRLRILRPAIGGGGGGAEGVYGRTAPAMWLEPRVERLRSAGGNMFSFSNTSPHSEKLPSVGLRGGGFSRRSAWGGANGGGGPRASMGPGSHAAFFIRDLSNCGAGEGGMRSGSAGVWASAASAVMDASFSCVSDPATDMFASIPDSLPHGASAGQQSCDGGLMAVGGADTETSGSTSNRHLALLVASGSQHQQRQPAGTIAARGSMGGGGGGAGSGMPSISPRSGTYGAPPSARQSAAGGSFQSSIDLGDARAQPQQQQQPEAQQRLPQRKSHLRFDTDCDALRCGASSGLVAESPHSTTARGGSGSGAGGGGSGGNALSQWDFGSEADLVAPGASRQGSTLSGAPFGGAVCAMSVSPPPPTGSVGVLPRMLDLATKASSRTLRPRGSASRLGQGAGPGLCGSSGGGGGGGSGVSFTGSGGGGGAGSEPGSGANELGSEEPGGVAILEANVAVGAGGGMAAGVGGGWSLGSGSGSPVGGAVTAGAGRQSSFGRGGSVTAAGVYGRPQSFSRFWQRGDTAASGALDTIRGSPASTDTGATREQRPGEHEGLDALLGPQHAQETAAEDDNGGDKDAGDVDQGPGTVTTAVRTSATFALSASSGGTADHRGALRGGGGMPPPSARTSGHGGTVGGCGCGSSRRCQCAADVRVEPGMATIGAASADTVAAAAASGGGLMVALRSVRQWAGGAGSSGGGGSGAGGQCRQPPSADGPEGPGTGGAGPARGCSGGGTATQGCVGPGGPACACTMLGGGADHSREGAPGAELGPATHVPHAGAHPSEMEVWHEVVVSGLRHPATGAPLLMVTQHDVSARVWAEQQLARVMEAEHALLEAIFPAHVLEHIAIMAAASAEGGVGDEADATPLLAARPTLQGLTASAFAQAEAAGLAPEGPRGAALSHGPPSAPEAPALPITGDTFLHLATSHSALTVLFCDIQGFTTMCNQVKPATVMAFLNDLYTRLDAMLDAFGVYKVETIGDCYVAAGGLMKVDEETGAVTVRSEDVDPQHANRTVQFAKALLRAAAAVRLPTTGEPVRLRVGIHSGPAMSGVVGTRMPRFCLFGDTINTASRMESTGEPGAIHVSQATRDLLPGEDWEPTGGVEAKGKGRLQTYLLRPSLEPL